MLDQSRTVAIVCATGEWPSIPQLVPTDVFTRSASAVADYLRDPAGMGLDPANVCEIIDVHSAEAHYDTISAFLAGRADALGTPQGAGLTVLFYFSGHGRIWEDMHTLVLRGTRPPLDLETSLRSRTLAAALHAAVPRSLRVILLDCCFAAAAVSSFQSDLDQVGVAQGREVVAAVADDRGVAVVSAADANVRASSDSPTGYTRFAAALLRVLRDGDPAIGPALDLQTVTRRMREHIAAEHGAGASLPSVAFPRQPGRDLGTRAIFPNPSAGRVPPGPGGSGAEAPAHDRNPPIPDGSAPGKGEVGTEPGRAAAINALKDIIKLGLGSDVVLAEEASDADRRRLAKGAVLRDGEVLVAVTRRPRLSVTPPLLAFTDRAIHYSVPGLPEWLRSVVNPRPAAVVAYEDLARSEIVITTVESREPSRGRKVYFQVLSVNVDGREVSLDLSPLVSPADLERVLRSVGRVVQTWGQ